MELVQVESPYASEHDLVIEFHEWYLAACLRDCLLRGEAPFASHGLYTRRGVLRDRDRDERRIGITAGFAFRAVTTLTAVYEDLGLTPGMVAGIEDAKVSGRRIEHRQLAGNWQRLYVELLTHFKS